MSLLKRIHAKIKKNTVLSKLNMLKKEWISGQSTNADVAFWEKALHELETEIIPYFPDLEAEKEGYAKILDLIRYEGKRAELSGESVPCMVFSGLGGDIATLNKQGKEHSQPGDRWIVLGDFISTDNEQSAKKGIEKAMDRAVNHDVFFILGKTEKEQLLRFQLDPVEKAFIQHTPSFIDTRDFSFFADKEGDGTIDLRSVLKGDAPNFTNKMLVFRSVDLTKDAFELNQDSRVMALQRGVATRLDFKEEKEENAEQEWVSL